MTKKRKIILELSGEELIQEYVRLSVEMGQASESFEIGKYNRLFSKEVEVLRELRSREGDQRHKLFALYAHPNLQVRLNAAHATYPLNAPVATAELEAIAATKRSPQGPDAGMTLSGIKMGISKLHDDSWI